MYYYARGLFLTHTHMENHIPSSCESRPRRCGYFIAGLLTLALIAGGVFHEMREERNEPDEKLYQVVLLNNDQAFFGKLHNLRGQYPYLTDVYYLKSTGPTTDATGRLLDSNQSYNVIKRGTNEIHSPTDSLYLNSKNIIYWENVGADSLVMKGINTDKEYRATGKAPANIPVVPTAMAPAADAPAATGTPATGTPATK